MLKKIIERGSQMKRALYRVSTWDPAKEKGNDFGWRVRVARCGKWKLKRVFRRLLAEGYDTVGLDCSIMQDMDFR